MKPKTIFERAALAWTRYSKGASPYMAISAGMWFRVGWRKGYRAGLREARK